MKYYETNCTEYIAAAKQFDMHPELNAHVSLMPGSLNQLGNLIFYGPSGTGKYTQFLRFIEKYAANGLKTEKMTASTEKQNYEYSISDIHYEIDLALLGCESKKVWNECFFQIVDIVSAKKSKCGIILCKNFQSIHSELLDVFYSYMQHCRELSIHIIFAILTEHVSFIPNRILQCCKMISVKRPPVELYNEKCADMELAVSTPGQQRTHKDFVKQILPMNKKNVGPMDFFITRSGGESKNAPANIVPEFLLNMKELNVISKMDNPPKDVFNIVCDNIISKMVQHETLDILSLRDNLYDILLYGLDITECLWYILYFFVESDILVDETGEVMSEIMDKIDSFLKYYNNNYRPIYHLESIFIYLITKIYRYPAISE